MCFSWLPGCELELQHTEESAQHRARSLNNGVSNLKSSLTSFDPTEDRCPSGLQLACSMSLITSSATYICLVWLHASSILKISESWWDPVLHVIVEPCCFCVIMCSEVADIGV